MPKPIPPVAAPAQIAAAPMPTPPAAPAPPAPVPQPSPMARAPAAPSQRLVPSVQTGRGVVRTDTHNQANQLPADAKHKGRGF